MLPSTVLKVVFLLTLSHDRRTPKRDFGDLRPDASFPWHLSRAP
jgi:hypothetical protein